MKRRSRIGWLFLSVLLAFTTGAAIVWLAPEKESEVSESITVPKPTRGDLRTFAATKVFFGHQSVGANVIDGVATTFSEEAAPAPTIVETRTPLTFAGGFFAHAYVGLNGDPYGKFKDFHSALDGELGDSLDVAALKLCYVDIVAGTDVGAVFEAYSSMMTDLARRHPRIRFLYTTIPLTTDRGWKSTVKSWIGQDDHMGPADNLARQHYNELVRTHYGATGRLFDIAAVEATTTQGAAERHLGNEVYYVMNSALAADPGHLNDLGSRLAAAEFIRVVVTADGEP